MQTTQIKPYKLQTYSSIDPGSDLWRRLENNPDWIMQPKYNDIRLQVHVIDNHLHVFNRHGEPYHGDFPGGLVLAWAIRGELGDCVIDCGLFFDSLLLYDLLDASLVYKDRLGIIQGAGIEASSTFVIQTPPTFPFTGKIKIHQADYWAKKEGVVLKNLNGKLRLSTVSAPQTRDVLKYRF